MVSPCKTRKTTLVSGQCPLINGTIHDILKMKGNRTNSVGQGTALKPRANIIASEYRMFSIQGTRHLLFTALSSQCSKAEKNMKYTAKENNQNKRKPN